MTPTETYLKTQQIADALGVSVSTIKRWVDEGSIEAIRTSGKHRRVTLASALKFARSVEMPVGRLLELAEIPTISAIDDGVCVNLMEALKQGRAREAHALILAAHGTGIGAVGLADRLIRPVMEKVGHGWMISAWDVYQEHQASQIVASALMDLNSRAARAADAPGPMAIGAAPEGDPYVLPGLLGELVLREVGWSVHNLGNNLPLRSLARAARDYRPRLIFLTASYLADRSRFLQEYAYFYEAASQVGAAIILGGRAIDPDLRSRLVYASFGERMAHLAEFARRLLPASGTNPDAAPEYPGPMDTST